jgi:N-acetyl sugar amidotransferase
MDGSDPDLDLDREGRCRYCRRADEVLPHVHPSPEHAERQLRDMERRIRAAGEGQEYDCVIGLSGGVDSSYTAYIAHQRGLRALAVHFDNGWDSELAVDNIRRVVERTGFDLITYVINWAEFRDLQRSFLKASVIDIELLTDHAIFAAMLGLAKERRIKYVLSGNNVATEHGLPIAWVWNKQDWTNIRAIHAAYGRVPLTSFPHLTSAEWLRIRLFRRGLRVIEPLNLIWYRRDLAAATLASEAGWREYGGKHHESLFTKFYQGFILPTKFGVDKRRAHLSDRIRNGELTRQQALDALQRPMYEANELVRERDFVLKKLGFTDAEFDEIMAMPPRPHASFASDRWWMDLARAVYRPIRRLAATR